MSSRHAGESEAPSERRSAARLRLLRLTGRALATHATLRTPGGPRKVLLVRPDHVGDVLLTAPAVALLRASWPAARLTYLVGPWSVDAARHGPPVDELRQLPFPGFTRRANANVLAPYLLVLRQGAGLRRERYDAAVLFRPDHWWGSLLALAAGIPVRIGGDTRENAPLLTHTCAAGDGEPAAEQALKLARLALDTFGTEPASLGEVEPFALTDAARRCARDLLDMAGLASGQVVAIHPAAGAALKSWPTHNWARLADCLIEDGLQVVLSGAPSDTGLLASIQQHMRHQVTRACGQSLETSAALYARCALVVTVDSGAGHLAAAVGAPTLRLYGPAPRRVFGPWPPRADQQVLLADELACVPCGALESPPCGARTTPACMLALGVETVLKAARAQLGRG